MSLASFEAALLQLAVDALDECDLRAPDEAIRHHGPLPTIPGCCTENGVLEVHWDETAAPADCTPPEWALTLRWVTCWPEDIKDINYASRDATSVRIADVSECILSALSREVCQWPQSALYAHAVKIRLGRTSPIPPGGKCAGVMWRIVVLIRRPESPAT